MGAPTLPTIGALRSMPQQVAVQLSTGSLEGCCLPFHPGALISTCGRPSRYPQECKWSGIATWMVNPPFKASSDISGALKTVHQPAHDIPHFLRPWDIDLSLRQHPTDLLNKAIKARLWYSMLPSHYTIPGEHGSGYPGRSSSSTWEGSPEILT